MDDISKQLTDKYMEEIKRKKNAQTKKKLSVLLKDFGYTKRCSANCNKIENILFKAGIAVGCHLEDVNAIDDYVTLTIVQTDTTGPGKDFFKRYKIVFVVISYILLFVLLIARRPDMLFNPQPWAEDGTYFLHDALIFGWKSIFYPYAGYLHFIPRITTLISLYLSKSLSGGIYLVPLFMNITAIAISIYSATYICTKRFDWLLPFYLRVLIAILVIISPASYEIYGTITNALWWLGFFQFLITWDMFVKKRIPHGFVLVILVLSCLSGPMGVFPALGCLYVILYKLLKDKDYESIYIYDIFASVIICSSSATEVYLAILLRNAQGSTEVGINCFSRLLFGGIFARSVIPDFAGFVNTHGFLLTMGIGAIILLFLIVANINNKVKIIFPLSYLMLLIAMTLIGYPILFKSYATVPFHDITCGRYFFLPMAIIDTLLILGGYNAFASKDRKQFVIFIIILCFFSFNILHNFNLQPYINYNWDNVAQIYQENGKDAFSIPINPIPWTIKIPTNIALKLPVDGWNLSGGWSLNGTFIKDKPDNLSEYIFGSWSGADSNTGRLISDSILVTKPSYLVMYVMVGPDMTGQTIGIAINNDQKPDILYKKYPYQQSQSWNMWIVDLTEYIGKDVSVIAEDNGNQWGQWCGISQPLIVDKNEINEKVK
jgi:hypothetical protein